MWVTYCGYVKHCKWWTLVWTYSPYHPNHSHPLIIAAIPNRIMEYCYYYYYQLMGLRFAFAYKEYMYSAHHNVRRSDNVVYHMQTQQHAETHTIYNGKVLAYVVLIDWDNTRKMITLDWFEEFVSTYNKFARFINNNKEFFLLFIDNLIMSSDVKYWKIQDLGKVIIWFSAIFCQQITGHYRESFFLNDKRDCRNYFCR